MRIAPFYILILFLWSSCTSIDNLEPNQNNTFLKFYSETSTMESKDLVLLEDGYLILSTYTDTTTMLLKTDLLGNKLWATSLPYFKGSSVTAAPDGYIVVGDSINTIDGTTFMQLIKTDIDNGNRIGSSNINQGTTHGSAVTFTLNNEIIALGYNNTALGDSIILMSYTTNLDDVWAAPRKYLSEIPSNTVYESNSTITWLSYYSNQSSLSLTTVLHDNEGNESNPTLFNGETLSNIEGDLVNTPGGYGVAHSVMRDGESKIAYSSIINGDINSEQVLIDGVFSDGNYNAYTLTTTFNGVLIAATTDYHDGSTRTDADLLLLEVDGNGNLVPSGINETFGGTGDEIPIRIKKTLDGGYIILGTSINSKGAMQTFLLKTNNKGILN